MLHSTRSRPRLKLICVAALAIYLAGCSVGTVSTTPTTMPGATPTPASACLHLIPAAALASGIKSVPDIQLPTGTYISPPTASGGDNGQYSVQSYALCFQGPEPAIDGGLNAPTSPPSSTLGDLVHAGWVLDNLFPDPPTIAFLAPCVNGRSCISTSGTPDPFTFVGVDQFASHSGGYTTFRLQVATIVAPTCLNDPNYYSGTPQYILFEDSPFTGGSNPAYHFQMPPATRVSSFRGGGTAGSSYLYFCSNGTQASVNAFLQASMQSDGYTEFGGISGGCFIENKGTNPTYSVQVCVSNPNNYYLRIFVPI